MSDFRLNRFTRGILLAVVEAMMPRWPEFVPPIENAVIARIEKLVGRASPVVRIGVPAGLWGLEWAGPLLGAGRLRRLSRVPLRERIDLLENLGGSRTPLLRRWIQIYRALIAISAYTDPRVEQHLGIDRAAWRQSRQRLRQRLLRADALRPAPPLPRPLGSVGVVTPDAYLDPRNPAPTTTECAT